MSIVEVLIASVILLIALTAMLALLLTSTGLSARARAESLAVTTASRFIETVRQTTYKNLTQTKLNQLATAASGTAGGMTVSITASMTAHYEPSQPASATPAYQEVKVLVSVAGPGFKTFMFRTGTFVREWRYSGTETRQNPTVDFDDETPPAGATARPVWASVHVGATAHSNMIDVVLTQINLVWRVSGQSASYLATATPGTDTGSCSTEWNTLAVPEGRRGTMYAECWDALNQPDSKTRDFIIDNFRPPVPGAVTLSSTVGNSQLTWGWTAVNDGETPVPAYEPTVYQLLPQPSPSTWNEWVATVQPAVGTNSFAFASSPFSLYYPSVVSLGPREVAGFGEWRSGATQGAEVLTRPGFSTMSVSVRQQNSNKPFYFTASPLALTPPTFKVTSASNYRWEYRIGSGAWTGFASAPSPNTNPSAGTSVSFPEVAGPTSGAQASLSFRCTATVTRPNGTTYATKSPILSVSNPNGGTTYTLASFTPDWTTSW
jgi:type II secretory pathway pseudopilin PulG